MVAIVGLWVEYLLDEVRVLECVLLLGFELDFEDLLLVLLE